MISIKMLVMLFMHFGQIIICGFMRLFNLMKFLGSSKVSSSNKITLTVEVAKELKAKLGDFIVFEKDEKGNILIRKG